LTAIGHPRGGGAEFRVQWGGEKQTGRHLAGWWALKPGGVGPPGGGPFFFGGRAFGPFFLPFGLKGGSAAHVGGVVWGGGPVFLVFFFFLLFSGGGGGGNLGVGNPLGGGWHFVKSPPLHTFGGGGGAPPLGRGSGGLFLCFFSIFRPNLIGVQLGGAAIGPFFGARGVGGAHSLFRGKAGGFFIFFFFFIVPNDSPHPSGTGPHGKKIFFFRRSGGFWWGGGGGGGCSPEKTGGRGNPGAFQTLKFFVSLVGGGARG